MSLISIIIPVYNAASLLGRAVQSVLSQDFEDYELILVDDGSKDDSGALCDEFAAKDSRIRVLHQDNGGVSVARNNGMKAAGGKYIAFLDADDWLEPAYLSSMVNLLNETGAKTAACGNFLSMPDGTETPEGAPMSAGFHSAEDAKHGIVIPLLCDRIREGLLNGYVWRYLFDASIISKNSISFSGAYLEDELFLIEYFSVGSDLAVVGEPLYHYYQNPGSVTRRYLKTYVDTFLSSFAIKEALVRKYSIPVPGYWKDNTCWGGLLIAAANEFAPGNDAGFIKKVRNLKDICNMPRFRSAIDNYVPENMNRNKTVVADLLRRGMYLPLAILYTIKNRNRR